MQPALLRGGIRKFFRYPPDAAPSASPATIFPAPERRKDYAPHHSAAPRCVPANRQKFPRSPIPVSRPWPMPAPRAASADVRAPCAHQDHARANEYLLRHVRANEYVIRYAYRRASFPLQTAIVLAIPALLRFCRLPFVNPYYAL